MDDQRSTCDPQTIVWSLSMPDYEWITDEIFTVSEFLSTAECAHYIQLAESLGFDEAPLSTAFGPQYVPEVRNNQRVLLDDAQLAGELWDRGRDFIPLRKR